MLAYLDDYLVGTKIYRMVMKAQLTTLADNAPDEDAIPASPSTAVDTADRIMRSTGELNHPTPPTFTDTSSNNPSAPQSNKAHGFNTSLDTTATTASQSFQQQQQTESKTTKPLKPNKKTRGKPKQKSTRIELLHCDLIREEFWDTRPGLLSD